MMCSRTRNRRRRAPATERPLSRLIGIVLVPVHHQFYKHRVVLEAATVLRRGLTGRLHHHTRLVTQFKFRVDQ